MINNKRHNVFKIVTFYIPILLKNFQMLWSERSKFSIVFFHVVIQQILHRLTCWFSGFLTKDGVHFPCVGKHKTLYTQFWCMHLSGGQLYLMCLTCLDRREGLLPEPYVWVLAGLPLLLLL